ncbi:MAG: MarR family transcriptional regulator [Chloroflexi bacterium]|nr:MAG: MarR family transcriptional regulator [Chloroflexota bacterium]
MIAADTPSVSSLLGDVHPAYHVLARLVARQLEDAAVSMPEALVLRIVRTNRLVTMRELLEATGACNSTMASLVTRLETRGLVERHQLAGDRRHTLTRPTRLGGLVGGMVGPSLELIEKDLAVYITLEEREGIATLAAGLFSLERPEFFSKLDWRREAAVRVRAWPPPPGARRGPSRTDAGCRA